LQMKWLMVQFQIVWRGPHALLPEANKGRNTWQT
jgi:hypothetical protein